MPHTPRTREEIERNLQKEFGNFLAGDTNPYPMPLYPLLEVLLDNRDLLIEIRDLLSKAPPLPGGKEGLN